MRISSFFVPFFSLLAGAAGFYLRLMERWDVFVYDGRFWIPERNATVTILLIILTSVFLLLIAMFAISAARKHKAPRGFENAFGTDPISYPFMFTVIGLVWLSGTLMHFFNLRSTDSLQTIDIYFTVLSALSAISVAFFAIEMYQDARRKSTFALSVVPTIFACFWLILIYQANASNPSLLDYCYQSLAIITTALAFYYTSGFLYGKPAPGFSIFTYYASIFFCFVTMADNHPVSIRIIFASFIAINMIHSSMLLKNLRRK